MNSRPPSHRPLALEQVRKEKEILETVIRDALNTFESRTGCIVMRVDLERVFLIDQPVLLGSVTTEVRL